ncbi:DUF4055 domain-containing protein [Pseudomonas bharatica]|uniref:DUF4055 domain-containing protein n=1 Tax=Pseudomonas bharatica TaxID=2692112 RepID=UPI001F04FE93|nr:DUF4055 domain-containing protein [Pseudomonas bharatica]
MAALDFLSLPSSLAWAVAACALSAAAAGSVGYGLGDRQATAAGAADLADLKREHAERALASGQRNLDDLLSEMRRANDAEAQLLAAKTQHQTELEQLQERIPNVTTVYLPAPAAKPVAIPRCVFTAGWLRDYNAALGVPANTKGTAAGNAEAAAKPAPALMPSYWKAASLPQTSWPTPRTTACGLATTWRSSTPCSTFKNKRTDRVWM